MTDDRTPEDLRAAQRRREAEEQDLASSSLDEQEAAQHERRADKARYLREKLEARTASEREAEEHSG